MPKLIVKGKIYDTDTAVVVCYATQGTGFDAWKEELYRTPNGNYFICNHHNDIVVLDDNGFLVIYDEVICHINDWLEQWDVTDLEEREIKKFGIVNA